MNSHRVGLDVLRIAAIAMVILFHYPKAAGQYLFRVLGMHGWMGVDLFFVLSGFLIGSQLLAQLKSGASPLNYSFYLRRTFRIIPNYLVALCLSWTLANLNLLEPIGPLLGFLTFTMNFTYDFVRTPTFGNAWSLCVEEHFYLLFPIILFAVKKTPQKISRSTLTIGMSILIIVGGCILRALLWRAKIFPILNSTDLSRETAGVAYLESIYFPTYCRLDGLLMGIGLAVIKVNRTDLWIKLIQYPKKKSFTIAFFILLFAAAIARRHYEFIPAVFVFPLISFAFSILLVAVYEIKDSFLNRHHRFIQQAAELAFALYLTHQILFHLIENALLKSNLNAYSVWCAPLYLVPIIPFALILNRLVERPFLRMRDRILT